MLFGVIYLLRSFFLLIFLTFVFSYIQSRGVEKLQFKIKNRTIRVALIAVVFWTLLCAAGVFLVPKVKAQAELFISEFTVYLGRVDQELFSLRNKYPVLGEILPELEASGTVDKDQTNSRDQKYSPTGALLQQLLKVGEETGGIKNVNHLLSTMGDIGGKIISVTSAFLLALLFSFLIILDLPRLTASVRGLEQTSLRFVYLSVADTIRDFAHVLGKALEAQLVIATINSILTAIGITLLGLGEHMAFLSVIVFFCSFIPVVGVFMSSVPICLIALQASGVKVMLLAILFIIAIHLVEGYILNPRVYGTYMRINPVIILIILTIGGKLFSIWGLLLGVPICTYIFGHAIRLQNK